MKRRQFIALSLSLFALASCGGGPWHIVRQAPGNPFGSAPVVAVLVDFNGLMLDTRRPIPEAEYLSTKTPEQQAAFQADKAAMAEHLMTEFSRQARGVTVSPEGATPGPNHFVVKASVTMLEPGSMMRQPEAAIIARIATPEGQVIEELNISRALQQGGWGGMRNAYGTTAGKMQRLGDALGNTLGRYLRERTGH